MDDLISRAAIEWHDFLVADGNGMYHEEKVAYKRQIDTLPSAQSKNTDCIYCHEDSDGYVKPIEKNGHAFIRFGMNGWEISLGAKGGGSDPVGDPQKPSGGWRYHRVDCDRNGDSCHIVAEGG